MKLRSLFFATTVFLLILVSLGPSSFSTTGAATAADSFNIYLPTITTSELPFNPINVVYGVNFINSVDHPADAQQFSNGQLTGADWNRWPLYWNRIETDFAVFDWSAHDPVVQGDIDNGFKTNAILLGTPGFYTTRQSSTVRTENSQPEIGIPLSLADIQSATPQGLYDGVFTDGTDVPGDAKTINPNNRWAYFVFTIVSRYKPGGVLAQQNGWTADQGITHWEMWNEADYSIFWDSSLADYARLLKVGYLAAKHADPEAQILFGGLANNGNRDFYEDVLAIYAADSLAAEQGFYHDIFATHNYSYAWDSWYWIWKASKAQATHNLDKPIWLNETGVPAWDDYPGPTWDSKSGLRATTAEQADFVIQSAFYSLYAGVDGFFHFQLYDGCGNQPAFTNFPPHSGELCNSSGYLKSDPSKPCAGDANGLFSNPTDAICFSQHPTPETARPNLTAYQLLTTHVQDVAAYWRSRPGGITPYDGPQEIIALIQPDTNKRIIAMWARDGADQTAVIEATSSQALLLGSDGSQQTIQPVDGVYEIQLPAATNQNAFWAPELYMIGGKTYILIEDLN